MPTHDLTFTLDRTLFFQIGRALQRGVGKAQLGTVSLSVSDGHLVIESEWGGGRIPCAGAGKISAQVTAKAFCTLITSRYREKEPQGTMEIVFRPALKEIAIDRAGVKAKF